MTKRSLVPDSGSVKFVDHETERHVPDGAVVATNDEQLIRDWAVLHGAEPATGEATSSGPATVNVQDGDSGPRFNFPSAAPFRPISWDEWFQNFHQHDLMFVYERHTSGTGLGATYRMVPKQKLRTDNVSRDSSSWPQFLP